MASAGDPPSLAQLLPYIRSTLTLAGTFIQAVIRLVASAVSFAFGTLSYVSPLPIISYLLAPFTVFLSTVVDLFVRTPYSIVLYLLDAVYPIYVFCGVACITGALIGLTGRLASGWIVRVLTHKGEEDEVLEREGTGVRRTSSKDKKGKGKAKREWDEDWYVAVIASALCPLLTAHSRAKI